MAKGIQSVDIAYRVLHALERSARPILLKDVAADVDMSPSKTRMYMVSLLRTGLVAQNEAGAYTLGPAALNLGLAAFNQVDLIDTSRTVMAALTRETQGPTMLSMWTGTSIMIIARGDSLDGLPIDFRIGGTASLANTATGRVFLAYLPTDATESPLLHEFDNAAKLGQTPVTLDALNERVALVRARGYDISQEVVLASDPRVLLNGYGAIAAPIVDIFRELRFVITVLYRKTDDARESDIIDNVVQHIRDALPTPQPPQA